MIRATLCHFQFFQKYHLWMRTDKIGIIFVKYQTIVCTMTNCIDMSTMTVIPFQTKPQQPKNIIFDFAVGPLP